MPTPDPSRPVALADLDEVVAATAFPHRGSREGIGVEVEVLPIRPGGGRPRRVPIDGGGAGLLSWLSPGVHLGHAPTAASRVGRGRFTFEPGGQLEYSGDVHRGPSAAVADANAVLADVAAIALQEGIVLASSGIDVWCDHDSVAQQLPSERYRTMDAYFAGRGRSGQRMMRHTASIQINVDPGEGAAGDARWRLTNLLAPMLVATFACSPAAPPDPAVSVRSRIWRDLDHSRTGVPNARGLGRPVDRVADLTAFALAADVMLLRRTDGSTVPGRPGFTLKDWIVHGDADGRRPTEADVRDHLSTLFPEVRPRGALEIRSVDALPGRWRAVPVTLLAGLLWHDASADHALDLLAPTASRLPERLVRAAETGLKDPEFCAESVEIWSYARAGAAALPHGLVSARDLATVDAFIDRYTLRGRAPSDELRDVLADDPRASLQWAAETSLEHV